MAVLLTAVMIISNNTHYEDVVLLTAVQLTPLTILLLRLSYKRLVQPLEVAVAIKSICTAFKSTISS